MITGANAEKMQHRYKGKAVLQTDRNFRNISVCLQDGSYIVKNKGSMGGFSGWFHPARADGLLHVGEEEFPDIRVFPESF